MGGKASPEYMTNWRAEHRTEARIATKAWKAAHPGHTDAWLAAHPGYNAAASRLHKARLYIRLTGRKRPKCCEVCHRHGQPIHYDHCHKSGLFRGWLCRDCNAVLGYVRDSSKILRNLADYLDDFKAHPKVKGQMAKDQKAYALKQAIYIARNKAKQSLNCSNLAPS